MSIPEMEKILLRGLVSKEEFAREISPYIKEEYFETFLSKQLFPFFNEYFGKYNTCPPKDMFLLELESSDLLDEHQFSDGKEAVTEIFECDISKYDMAWMKSKTEKWCQDRALINAVYKSIGIMDGTDKKSSTHCIPDMMREALSVTFDSSVGHDYIDDRDERFAYYHDVTQKVPCDLSMINTITKGGIPRKTLNVVMAATGGGKSQFLCHLAASYMKTGMNVLYLTYEMEEKRIAERIDANILDVNVDDLVRMDAAKYNDKTTKAFRKIMGKLIIKEYPAASSNVNHIKQLLQELKTKKNFIPDVIVVDYLNLMNSARFANSANANSYSTVKATAEELRGLAQEEEFIIWTATQTNRDGIGASDLSMSNTSESMGLPHTVDFFFGLVPIEELEAKNQILGVQLKNRYGPLDPNRKFILGLDRGRMKFYDVADNAQSNLNTNPMGQVDDSNGYGYGTEAKTTADKYKQVDFD